MDKIDKEIKIENFINNMSSSIDEVRKLISFMRIEDEKQIVMFNDAFDILENKLKKAKKCKSFKDSKKYIKIKKVIKSYEEQ